MASEHRRSARATWKVEESARPVVFAGFADVKRVVGAAENVDEPHSDDDAIVGRGFARIRRGPFEWWRRRESNPRPKARPRRTLHSCPLLFSHARREEAAKTA